MRLIDADALIALIKKRIKNSMIIGWLCNIIRDTPTIDAVPVVRCRECKHLNVVNRKELYAHCPKTNTVFLPFELDIERANDICEKCRWCYVNESE